MLLVENFKKQLHVFILIFFIKLTFSRVNIPYFTIQKKEKKIVHMIFPIS